MYFYQRRGEIFEQNTIDELIHRFELLHKETKEFFLRNYLNYSIIML